VFEISSGNGGERRLWQPVLTDPDILEASLKGALDRSNVHSTGRDAVSFSDGAVCLIIGVSNRGHFDASGHSSSHIIHTRRSSHIVNHRLINKASTPFSQRTHREHAGALLTCLVTGLLLTQRRAIHRLMKELSKTGKISAGHSLTSAQVLVAGAFLISNFEGRGVSRGAGRLKKQRQCGTQHEPRRGRRRRVHPVESLNS